MTTFFSLVITLVLCGSLGYYMILILEIHERTGKIEKEVAKITSVAEALRKWAERRDEGGGAGG